MSNPLEELDLNKQVDESAQADTKTNPDVERATSFGWLPKEDWVAAGNDPEDWISAKNYNKNSELYGKVIKQSNKLAQYETKLSTVERALQTLSDHHVKVAEAEREKVLRELKKQKVEALREDDLDTAVEIDDKISDIKQEAKQEKAETKANAGVNPTIEAWVSNPDNSWYHEDFDLRDEADRYFDYLMKTKKASNLEEALQKTEQRIRDKHPGKFSNTVHEPTPKRTNKVIEQDDSGTPRKSSPKQKHTMRDLGESDRVVVRQLAKAAGKSEQEYVEQLAAEGYFN